jgi:hypothetical protein
MMYDLAIIDNNFHDSDPGVILEHVKSAHRAVAYVSRERCEEYKGRLQPHRIMPLKSRVYAKPDAYFEWGPDPRPRQLPVKPPAGSKPRLSSLCCFSMLEFMPESVPSRRVFQVGMQ